MADHPPTITPDSSDSQHVQVLDSAQAAMSASTSPRAGMHNVHTESANNPRIAALLTKIGEVKHSPIEKMGDHVQTNASARGPEMNAKAIEKAVNAAFEKPHIQNKIKDAVRNAIRETAPAVFNEALATMDLGGMVRDAFNTVLDEDALRTIEQQERATAAADEDAMEEFPDWENDNMEDESDDGQSCDGFDGESHGENAEEEAHAAEFTAQFHKNLQAASDAEEEQAPAAEFTAPFHKNLQAASDMEEAQLAANVGTSRITYRGLQRRLGVDVHDVVRRLVRRRFGVRATAGTEEKAVVESGGGDEEAVGDDEMEVGGVKLAGIESDHGGDAEKPGISS